MSKQLVLSTHLSLPLEAATRRLAILAMSGAGKSNVAVVLAEQMFAAGIPWVAIDPKGDWWGVRSSKDGKGPGLPVTIFGGLHGDIPLEHTAGQLIADTIVDQRLTCILDISEFPDRQKQWGFLIDLGETLLRRNREALHLFLEEADEYLPQKLSDKGNLPRCLGVWQRVVKRGRFRGIGSTQITQRNASLNKDTLYQAEALIAMRVGGKADREAVKGWVDYHAASADIVSSLATLGDGEGWISSPAWLRRTERVKFNRRTTFDSGATPVHLKGRTAPATLADVNLDALRVKMADTLERVKAEDPKLLTARIRQLESQLSKTHFNQEQVGPIIQREVDRQIAAFRATEIKAMSGTATELVKVASLLEGAAVRLRDISDQLRVALDNVPKVEVSRALSAPAPRRMVAATTDHPAIDRNGSRLTAGSSGVKERILNTIAGFLDLGISTPDKATVAAMCGYHPNAKSYANAMGSLRSDGLVEYPTGGRVALTDAGAKQAKPSMPVRNLSELHQLWAQKLGGVAAKILEPVVRSYPDAVTTEALAEAAGYHPNAKSFANMKGRLRTLGLIDYPTSGMVVATDILFPKGLQ